MNKTIQAILERIDRQAIDVLRASLVDTKKMLALSKNALRDSRDKTPLLDRLNPFKTTDGEREIKRHKTDCGNIEMEVYEINKQLKGAVCDAIAKEPKAQLAISLSKLDKNIEELESSMHNLSIEESMSVPNDGEIDKSQFEIDGLDSMRESLSDCRSSMDDLANQLSELVGIETGRRTEQSLLSALIGDEPGMRTEQSLVSELDKKFEEVKWRMRDLSIKESMSVPNAGEIDKPQFEVDGLDPMRESLKGCRSSLNDLANQLSELVGVERGIRTEQSLIDAAMKELS